MRARAADEPHRASTPLELFFDLCFVVAVAQAVGPLHHAVADGHALTGLANYLSVFFAIWWAWLNFSWFASAYDTDDVLYRVMTLVQVAGALVLAAGLTRAFDDGDFRVDTIGYVVMRLALVAQWLRAARSDRQRRPTALRYATGIVAVQVLWLLRLLIDAESGWFLPSVLVLIALELAVPVWAEHAPGGPTTFHPRHIAERYGLFTIIVLGESVASTVERFRDGEVAAAVSGLVIVFSLWWLYFNRPAHELLDSLRHSLLWGYGHFFILAAAAAVGIGPGAGYAVAVYLFFVWLLHRRAAKSPALLVGAVLALLTPLAPASAELLAAVLVVLVAVDLPRSRDLRTSSAGTR
ncbi:low temperature requirement protein A [Actinoplanes sp. Pm04-4]|uniref:Low temperature requirement protein A n=1 Tax=Paractinoplanes pyxinae TaxID=2997416 RepID=A0ABT4AS13_9ACTN|nr:low temperature requirement protein A [Actinoplanes pyxinae]MCY1137030.1 low temperature requirement protein A [Actinoplanes pyxinae]